MAQYRYERLQGEYAQLWATMRVVKTEAAIAQAKIVIAHRARYEAVAAATGVPWFVVGPLHLRESGGNFATWLHNGDPMRRGGQPVQTVHVPAHRPPNPDCSWEEGARDALVTCEHLDEVRAWCPERVAYSAEGYNGFGYRAPSRDIPSPYLWGGTSVQKRGKFTGDGEYDPNEWDPQLGVMAVLKVLLEICPDAKFADAAPAPAPPAEPEDKPVSPKAIDTETRTPPLKRSRTIWGGVITAATSLVSTVVGFFDKLQNPYTLAAFLALLACAAGGAWLVASGRVNVERMLAHLSEDDTNV